MPTGGRVLLLLLLVVAVVYAYNDPGLPADPYLAYKPAFARSLPVQILVTGVVFTLTSVLFVHLLFTGQYHWPLAPVNYVLQVSGVITLLISLIATLNVVLQRTMDESSQWPYMVSYIAVAVPPSTEDVRDDPQEWSIAERATWFIMEATTSVLVQITHVQFLTLLYPSSLERRLIFSMLGPLAILAAIMQLVPISSSAQVNDVASAIRNVCNATLSLLFTAALFIWGLLVNRKQAWRTDGGTAVFGAAALALAVASTALSFLDIPREEEYVWLPGLMWAVVLWQSFLGWWWWVGSASGGAGATGDELAREDATEEVIRRGQKISRRRKERREERRRQQSEGGGTRESVSGGWRSVFSSRGGDGDEIEQVPRARTRRRRRETSSPTARRSRSPHTEVSSPSNATSTTDTTSSFLPSVIYHWFANLRQAHLTAARIQAAERRERILELERAERERVRAEVESRRRGNEINNTSPWFRVGVPGTGWGLGSSGWRMENGGVEQVEMQTYSRKSEDEGSTSPRHRGSLRRTDADADIEILSSSEAVAAVSPPEVPIQNTHDPPAPEIPQRPSSVFWWGPFRRWRLQDSTIY